jgi:hypothetical protein
MLDERVQARIGQVVSELQLPQTAKDRWFSKREIRCFQQEGFDEEIALFAGDFVRSYISGLRLSFVFIEKGVNPNSTANITRVMKRGLIDTDWLSSGILKNEAWRYREGYQHGDILLLESPFKNGQEYHSSFEDGALFLHEQAARRMMEGDNADGARMRYELDRFFGYNQVGFGPRAEVVKELWKNIFSALDSI